MKDRCPSHRITFATAFATLLLLSACGTTLYRNSLHPEYGQTAYDRDRYECRRENSYPAAKVAGAYGSAGVVVNENMADQCFRARGWYPVSDSQTSSQPSPSAPIMRPKNEGPCDLGMYWNSVKGQCLKIGVE